MKELLIAAACAFLAVTGMAAVTDGPGTKGVPGPDSGDKVNVVNPKRTEGPVINPGKGWIGYGNPGRDEDANHLCSVGYNRYEWGDLEPEEGKFNWEPLDRFIKAWGGYGKQVAFGVMLANTHSKTKDGYSTPKWVFDAGVSASVMTIKEGADAMTGTPGVYHLPTNFNDPLLMKKLENFLKALARRYDGLPSIAFIDIRSFGNWGELMSEEHVLLWRKHFNKTRLCQSTQGAKLAKWCAERGVACRRDGIGGSKGEELIPAAGRVPAIFEFWGPVWYLDKRGWWDDGMLIPKAIEIGKPTYVEIVRGSPEFLRDYRALIDKVTNRIGFHFVLEKAGYPGKMQKGQSAEIALTWKNEGVAPFYVPCVTKLALIDTKDKIVAVTNVENSDPEKWLPDQSTAETCKATFAGANLSGTYKLAIGLSTSQDSDTPVFLIGIETPMVGKWHVLGDVQVD